MYFHKGFDEQLAKTLYESEDAKSIIAALAKKGTFPFLNFPKEYLKYALQNGAVPEGLLYSKYIFDCIKLVVKVFSEAMNRGENSLDEAFVHHLSREFIPYYIDRKHLDIGLYLRIEELLGLQFESLSVDNWKRICSNLILFATSLSKKRSREELTKLLEAFGYGKPTIDSASYIPIFHMQSRCFERTALPSREIFNPNLNVEYRKILVKMDRCYDIEKVMMKTIDYAKHKNLITASSNNQKAILKQDSKKWQCILQIPSEDLMTSEDFWMYFAGDFWKEIRETEHSAFFYNVKGEALEFLNHISNAFVDSLSYGHNVSLDDEMFWAKMFPERKWV